MLDLIILDAPTGITVFGRAREEERKPISTFDAEHQPVVRHPRDDAKLYTLRSSSAGTRERGA